jgi:hypothetical protein
VAHRNKTTALEMSLIASSFVPASLNSGKKGVHGLGLLARAMDHLAASRIGTELPSSTNAATIAVATPAWRSLQVRRRRLGIVTALVAQLWHMIASQNA